MSKIESFNESEFKKNFDLLNQEINDFDSKKTVKPPLNFTDLKN